MNAPFAAVMMPKAMDHLRITEFASQQVILRRYLDSHRDWIEHHPGCRMEFRGSSEIADQDSRMAQLQKQVVAVEFRRRWNHRTEDPVRQRVCHFPLRRKGAPIKSSKAPRMEEP